MGGRPYRRPPPRLRLKVIAEINFRLAGFGPLGKQAKQSKQVAAAKNDQKSDVSQNALETLGDHFGRVWGPQLEPLEAVAPLRMSCSSFDGAIPAKMCKKFTNF